MPLDDAVCRRLIVEPGTPAAVASRATDWLPDDLAGLPDEERKAAAKDRLHAVRSELAEGQERLWATNTWGC